jgi:NAD dependent epimerase/dehydratase family enzyme
VWLQAGTATIYAHRLDAANDEATGILGGAEPNAPDTWRFSIDVAESWERALNESLVPHTRKVVLRSAMTMSPDRGGVFDVLLGLVRWGLGGKAGRGRQYVSWIHDLDFVRAIDFLIQHEELTGPINLASPGPVPNAELMRSLRQAWGISIGLPATEWMLEVGTFFLRTETELVLKSRRVVPGRLLQAEFTFRFPDWAEAARDLCSRWRELRGRGSPALPDR